MNNRLKNLIFIFLFIFFCFNFEYSKAQNISIPAQIPELDQQISIEESPQTPNPLDDVTITLSAYGTNLNLANITWKVDNITAQKGPGMTKFTIKAGDAGVTKIVNITIEPVDGGIVNKTITISPQDVDLIWESHTYTPPFYKGKAMYSPQEKVNIVAMPNFLSKSGVGINPSKLVYTWRQDDSVIEDQSGYAKNVLRINGSILLQPTGIEVEVTGSGKEDAKKIIALSPTLPTAIFYENNPLYGVLFNKALYGNFDFKDALEKNIEAFPFFFGANKKSDGNLAYEWNINGAIINLPANQSGTTFRNTTGDSGTSAIGVKIDNNNNFIEEANQSLNINFNASKKLGL